AAMADDKPVASPPAIAAAAPTVINEAAPSPAAAAPADIIAPAATPGTLAEPAMAKSAAAPASAPASAPANDAKSQPAQQQRVVVDKPAPPPITLKADVDLTNQRITITENGRVAYTWPISSGREGYPTITGTFKPTWMSKMHYSRKYDMSPMPHSVFFHGGFAIHATYATGMLGRPASHGCVRLSPANAKTFYDLVSRHGKASTKIAVFGSPRFSAPKVAKSKPVRQPNYATYDWGFGSSDPYFTKPAPRQAQRRPVGAPPKVVYRNGQAYVYVGPQAAKKYYSGGYSSY
ncbi:MAG: L,D-transpeptidase, partial [Hyphomicrobiaceae bacterium]